MTLIVNVKYPYYYLLTSNNMKQMPMPPSHFNLKPCINLQENMVITLECDDN